MSSDYTQWKKAAALEGGKWHCWEKGESHENGDLPFCKVSLVEEPSEEVFGYTVTIPDCCPDCFHQQEAEAQEPAFVIE